MLSALSFLTVLGPSRRPDRHTLRWFPLVGAALGALLAIGFEASRDVWITPIAAALVIAADVVLTGGLHVDGLADTADGVLPHLERTRRLEVMRMPDVGAFGVAAVAVVILLRWSAVFDPALEPWSLVWIWAGSRTLMAAAPAFVPYARDEGLASPLLDGASPSLLVWLAPIAVGLWMVAAWQGIAALGALVAVGCGVVALAHRRLGGFTGDVLGAAGILAETAALLALVARL